MENKNLSLLLNTPILLIGFNRPNLLQKRLKEINQFGLRNLFISIDGGSTEQQIDGIKLVLDDCLFESSINYRVIIHNENLGLARHITNAISEVLNEFSHVIVVEDDIVLGANFFDSILCGLEIADSDSQIATVGGFSPFFHFSLFSRKNYWRKSEYFSAWGWGISRANWNSYLFELESGGLEDKLSDSKTWSNLSSHQKLFWLSKFRKVTIKPIRTWDYQMQFMSFLYDKKHLLPAFRFCDNEGFNDSRGVNNVSKRPRWLFDVNAKGLSPGAKYIPYFIQPIFRYVDKWIWARDSTVKDLFLFLRRF